MEIFQQLIESGSWEPLRRSNRDPKTAARSFVYTVDVDDLHQRVVIIPALSTCSNVLEMYLSDPLNGCQKKLNTSLNLSSF